MRQEILELAIGSGVDNAFQGLEAKQPPEPKQDVPEQKLSTAFLVQAACFEEFNQRLGDEIAQGKKIAPSLAAVRSRLRQMEVPFDSIMARVEHREIDAPPAFRNAEIDRYVEKIRAYNRILSKLDLGPLVFRIRGIVQNTDMDFTTESVESPQVVAELATELRRQLTSPGSNPAFNEIGAWVRRAISDRAVLEEFKPRDERPESIRRSVISVAYFGEILQREILERCRDNLVLDKQIANTSYLLPEFIAEATTQGLLQSLGLLPAAVAVHEQFSAATSEKGWQEVSRLKDYNRARAELFVHHCAYSVRATMQYLRAAHCRAACMEIVHDIAKSMNEIAAPAAHGLVSYRLYAPSHLTMLVERHERAGMQRDFVAMWGHRFVRNYVGVLGNVETAGLLPCQAGGERGPLLETRGSIVYLGADGRVTREHAQNFLPVCGKTVEEIRDLQRVRILGHRMLEKMNWLQSQEPAIDNLAAQSKNGIAVLNDEEELFVVVPADAEFGGDHSTFFPVNQERSDVVLKSFGIEARSPVKVYESLALREGQSPVDPDPLHSVPEPDRESESLGELLQHTGHLKWRDLLPVLERIGIELLAHRGQNVHPIVRNRENGLQYTLSGHEVDDPVRLRRRFPTVVRKLDLNIQKLLDELKR